MIKEKCNFKNNQFNAFLRSHYVYIILGLIIVIAGLLRFHGLFNDSPYFFNPDERRLIQWGMDFNYSEPNISEWGALPLLLVKLFTTIFSFFDIPTRTDIYIIARVFSVVLAVTSILFVYLLTKQLYSRQSALYAAIFTTVTVLHIQYSHFYSLDGLFSSIILVAFFPILKVAQIDNIKAYILAGIIIGLATATRLNGVLLFIPACIAYFYNNYDQSFWNRAKLLDSKIEQLQVLLLQFIKLVANKKLLLMFACFICIFFIINPAIILDTKKYLFTDGLVWVLLQSSGYIKSQYTLQFEGTTPWFFVLNLFWGAGPFLLVSYIIGSSYIIFKWQKIENWLIFSFILLYLWFSASARVKFIRYSLPLLPLLNIIAANFFFTLQKTTKNHPILKSGVIGWLSLTIIGSTFYALAFTNIYSLPDTRIVASEWIKQNIKCSRILHENDEAYIPPLIDNVSNNQLSLIDFGYLYESSTLAMNSYIPSTLERLNINISRRGQLPLSQQDGFVPLSDTQKRQYLGDKIQAADYIVLSDRHYSVYKDKKKLFPVENEYYSQLFNNGLDFRPIQVFERKPNLMGWTIDDSKAELTFRIFDHPTIWVFQAQPSMQGEPTHKLDIDWNDQNGQIHLFGYDINQDAVQRGEEIELTLYWGASGSIEKDYTIFVHLQDDFNQIVVQNDHQVQDGAVPTSCWSNGIRIRDKITLILPSDISVGKYHLRVGLYSVETLERLPLTNDITGENAISLVDIKVR